MDKRDFMKKSIALGASLISVPAFSEKHIFNNKHDSSILAVNGSKQSFEQIKLPYSYDSLEPYIDAATMKLHYSAHHAAYTANLNKAATEEKILNKSIEEIFKNVSHYSSSVRNNGGGFYNHNLFWQCMTPGGKKLSSGSFKRILEATFGSFDEFKNQFSQKAATVFGSGWAWLIEREGKLYITSTPNQDNPLMDVVSEKGNPLLALDVWEHAYYLKYQNRRADYISAFWNVIDWDFVESRLG